MLKSFKTLAIITTILLSGIITLQAQEEQLDRREKRQELRAEHREQMQKFHHDEVEPVLRKMKEKFDASINKEDLAKLNEIRAKAKQLRDKHITERNKFREMVKNNPDSCFCKERKEKKANAKAHREEMQKLHAELEPIIKKYKDALSLLNESFESDLLSIQEKRQKLRSEMREKNQEFRKEGRRGKGHGHKGFGKKGKNFKGNDCKKDCKIMRDPERFLLWDGTSQTNTLE